MKTELILELFKLNCIKKGQFTLKNGETSPIYINLKNVISHPHILNSIANLMFDKINIYDFDKILGVPYGGLIFSTALSVKFNIPLLMVRKEKKNYGLKKNIEGEYSFKDKCIIIEDTITTGSSVKTCIENLDKELNINTILVVCDRRKKNCNLLTKYNVISLFNIDDIINTLYITSKIDNTFYYELQNYFEYKNHIKGELENYYCLKNNVIKLVNNKNSNIGLIADFKDSEMILKTIELYGNDICILKIYSDIIDNFNEIFIDKLITLKKKYNILIEDGKQFNKNEKIFFQEFTNTNKKIFSWIDILTLTDLHDNSIFNIIYTINQKKNKNIKIVIENYSVFDKALHILQTDNNVVGINSDYNNIDNILELKNVLKFKTYDTINYIGKIVYYLKKDRYYKEGFLSISSLKNNLLTLWNLN